MGQRRARTAPEPAPDPRLRPADLLGGEEGQLWATALELAGGDKSRIAIYSPYDVRIGNRH